MTGTSWIQSKYILPVARTAGHFGLAVLAALSPELGENHLLVAGLLAFLFGPIAFFLSLKLDVDKRAVIEPFLDMTTLLVIVAMMPEYWHFGLIIGVVIALAPAMALHPNSYRFYAYTSTLLVVGMLLIALSHQLSDWVLYILVLVAVFPPTILYAMSLNKKTEELRNQAEALSALQLVSGGIAHDFNNILTGISGFADIAKSEDTDPETTNLALRKIVNATEKASLLTSQLVAYAGNKASQYEVVDAGQEIQDVVDVVEGTLTEDVSFRLDLPVVPLYIYGDAIQFSRVVLNLLVNALEALQGSGVVSIRLFQNGTQVQIEIEDTGEGIAPDALGSIFEPFVGDKSSGHGLGLAIVKNNLQQLDGEIDVVSELGKGTIFTVTLPQVDKVDSAREDVSSNESKRCVLIADDEAAIRTILKRLLEDRGHEVIEAEDGDQFIELFSKHKTRIAAVVMDVKMPGKTGWQCLEEVRRFSTDLPALILSGYDPEGPTESDPAMRFLSKPFRISDFTDALRELLNRDLLASTESTRQ